jgi:peptide chain release factor 2
MSGAGFWQNQNISQAEAQIKSQSLSQKKSQLEKFNSWNKRLEDLLDMEEVKNSSQSEEQLQYEEMIWDEYSALSKEFKTFEFQRMMSGDYDKFDAIVSINAGAGGTDAQDWAEMLLRMYTRWAENYRDYTVELLERSDGEEAGLKSATIKVTGLYAYGYLSAEKGVHRLVRKSPFKSSADSRQTSFAGLEVTPVVADMSKIIELDDKDLEIDTMRSGGAGGQNVNKVESGVRVKHIPSGIVVKCTQERSQVQNKALALELIRSKLLAIREVEQKAKIAELKGDSVSASWGNAIRSYVLDEGRVKDVRTKYETRDVESVLNGGIDEFIEAYLRQEAK